MRYEMEPVVLPDVPVTVAMSVEIRHGRYEVTRLTVNEVETDREGISSELLRKVPVRRLVADSLEPGIFYEINPERWRPWEPPARAVVARARELGPTDDTLELVEHQFTIARLIGNPPARQVASVLHLPISTAGNWIRRAKDRGLIFDVPEA